MYYLECGQNYYACYHHENYGVICCISSGLWIVKRWQKFHVLFSRDLGYKIGLPILEIGLKIYSTQGKKITC